MDNGTTENSNGKSGLKAGKRQTEIPGTERKSNPGLDELVAPFVKVRMERIRLQKEEIKLHAQVLERMKDLKYPAYRFLNDDEEPFDLEVLPATEKVSIRRVKEQE